LLSGGGRKGDVECGHSDMWWLRTVDEPVLCLIIKYIFMVRTDRGSPAGFFGPL